MSRSVTRSGLRIAVVAIALLAIACGEQSPTRPLTESGLSTAQGPASQAALEAQINGLINALYAPTEQGAVQRDFARIKAQIASGRTADAQTSIVAFVQTVLGDLADGDLEDPNGAQPPTTADALASLVNAVAQFGGLPAPIPPGNPLGGDGAVAVVGPAGGTVVASSGFGGVQFPPGALPANVIVVVSRLPNPTQPNAGPLPTTVNQYPLFYDFSTTPPVAQFAQPVLVGICQLEVGEPFGPPTQTVANRLQLAHPNPSNPSTVEVLAREPAPFVDCAGVALAESRQRRQGEGILANALGTIRDIGTRAAAIFRPTPLYAVHGGLGGKTTSFSPFGAVDLGVQFVSVSVGASHACALDLFGQAWCWGSNAFGQLGDGSLTSRSVAAPAAGALRFQALQAGGEHTCGLTTLGSLHCWGLNNLGQLGNGTTANSSTPVQVLGGLAFESMSLAFLHMCGLTTAGVAYCWGSNQFGMLGTNQPLPICGVQPCATTPQAVVGGLAFSTISAGLENTCGVTTSGTAYCWGDGRFGQLGDGQPGTGACPASGTLLRCVDVPTPVLGGLQFQMVSVGSLFTCGLTTANAAYCWGMGGAGQLGDGSAIATTNVPIAVAGGLTFTLISAEGENATMDQACALTAAGAAYCWGANNSGQLGSAASETCPVRVLGAFCSMTPLLVNSGGPYQDIDTGAEFTCALDIAGAALCWGRNSAGQLGDGTTTNRGVPTPVVIQ